MRFLPRSRFGVIWRALLGGFLVIGLTAGAVATAGLLKVAKIAHSSTPAFKNAGTKIPQPGQPETLLLVGSDARWGQTGESNTDTMMLVRINDASQTINLLSVPRDLEVTIGGQQVKLNSAWSDGGPKLLINTLATQVFPNTNFYVSHLLNIDFTGFADLIDAIGCVDTMVDHRYYNYNNGNAANNFSAIDIQPGYQMLCGNGGAPDSALAFVRFRHNDSDLVRAARQQDFIRWAKGQFTSSELVDHESSLLSIFEKHVSTESYLHTTDGLLNLIDLVINANSSDTKSILFPTDGDVTVNGQDDLAPDTSAAVAAYKQFMTPTVKRTAPAKTTTTTTTTATTVTKTTAGKGGTTTTKRKTPAPTAVPVAAGMTADPSAGAAQATTLGSIGIPVYYPKYILSDSEYCSSSTANCDIDSNSASVYTSSYPRAYTLHDREHKGHAAYVMTLMTPVSCMSGGICTYFNVQGSAWQDPPILRDPTKVVTVAGRTLDEYYNGGKLSLVAWHTPAAVYWIANTLQDVLTPAQMVTLAASLTLAR